MKKIPVENCCGTQYLGLGYPDHLIQLTRFRFNKEHRCFACPKFKHKGVVEDYFHMLIWMLGESRGNIMVQYINFALKTLGYESCVHAYIKFMKEFTALAKKGGAYISPMWRYLCYWETAVGYNPEADLMTLDENVQEWLVIPRANGMLIGEDNYLDLLYSEACRFFTLEWSMPSEVPTLNDWIASGTWMRGKAGSGPSTKVTIQGKRVTTRKNKGVEAKYMSDINIYNEMCTPYPQRLQIMQKREPAKVRPVVKADNELFRKMDFLSEIIEEGLRGCRSSPVFMSSTANERLDIMIKEKLPMGINCPLDQGNFDNNQSKNTILVILLAMYDVVFSRAPKEYQMVWSAMWDSMIDDRSVVILGKKRYRWGNGLASGLRWTALLGTLLNILSFRVCKSIAQYLEPGMNTFDEIHQGDDIHFKVLELKHACALVFVMRECGYNVNPMKTYFSKTRTEFLRRSYEKGCITGYLGRSMTSIRFRNPINTESLSKPARAYERVAVAMLMQGRGADSASVCQYLIEDAKQIMISPVDMADFCLTPNAVGGVGLWSSNPAIAARLSLLGSGKWIAPKTTKESRSITVDLGWWDQRLKREGGLGDFKGAFLLDLLQSWGVPVSALYGDVNTHWVDIPKFEPMPIEGGMVLPHPAEVWKKLTIPTLMLAHWKQCRVRTDDFIPYIKEEYIPLMLELRDRVSSSVFIQYLTGTYSVPSPMVEGIGLKYGIAWKKKAQQMLFRAMSAQQTNMVKLRKKMLWIEMEGRRQLSLLSRYGMLAS